MLLQLMLTILFWERINSKLVALLQQLLPVIVSAVILSFVKKFWVDRTLR